METRSTGASAGNRLARGRSPVRDARAPRRGRAGHGCPDRAQDRRHGLPALASRPGRRSTGPASGSSPGPRPACSAASTATIPTPGRSGTASRSPLEQAVEEVRKYAHGLKAMKGGFTLSGGEPLMQDRFAARLFAAVKGMGVHTAIETNGFYGDACPTRSCATSTSSSST